MTIQQELDLFIKNINDIPSSKGYWLVRTNSGLFYESFREKNYIGIEHREIKLSEIESISKQFPNDYNNIIKEFKNKIRDKIIQPTLEKNDEIVTLRKISLLSNQIYKFVFELKKGDVVIIPSENSDIISFGIVKESYINNIERDDISKELILKKNVEWIKDVKRNRLDPNLYKIFFAHQAINDIKNYNEVIERVLNDFFILDNEAHLIINVEKEGKVSAVDLFGLGYGILELVKEFSDLHNLDINTDDLDVTVNINSPGSINLKSAIKKTTLTTGLILLFFGGGYKGKDGTEITTGGFPALLKAIDEFMNHQHDREMKSQIFQKYKDSLQVKNPNDMILLMKQFSENKDTAK
ncbi:MAG: hypothetical protein MUF43_13285 [Flavobacterium sp.]|jgi:hypothetical protein|nr:hypothetical protein [Flavobacterium sp.]